MTNLVDFSNCLRQVAEGSSSSHSWMCTDGKICQVLSQKEYESSRPSTLRKCTLAEMVSFSTRSLSQIFDKVAKNQTKLPPTSYAKMGWGITDKIVHLADVFSEDIEQGIIDTLRELNDLNKSVKEMSVALGVISKRSVAKHSYENTKGILGVICWYIWSWFFDTSKKITAIQNFINEIPDIKKDLADAITAVRERTITNMIYFEQEIDARPKEESMDALDEVYKKIDSPASVRKQWLIKYAEDKYQNPVSEKADAYRKRVIQLMKIWDALAKYDPENILQSPSVPYSRDQNKDSDAFLLV
jgi:hypothetical protein